MVSLVCIIFGLIEYFKINAEDVIVFHDDLDVEFGKIKATTFMECLINYYILKKK